jgi:hypothetical protein
MFNFVLLNKSDSFVIKTHFFFLKGHNLSFGDASWNQIIQTFETALKYLGL